MDLRLTLPSLRNVPLATIDEDITLPAINHFISPVSFESKYQVAEI
jgi:hypothetical protein